MLIIPTTAKTHFLAPDHNLFDVLRNDPVTVWN